MRVGADVALPIVGCNVDGDDDDDDDDDDDRYLYRGSDWQKRQTSDVWFNLKVFQ